MTARKTPPPSLADLAAYLERELPFHAHLGLRVEALEAGYARLRLPFKPEFIGDTRRPALHGGLISTLVDTCGGTAVWSQCGLTDRIATIDLRVDFLRPAPAADLVAEAWVRLLGNRVGNAQVSIRSSQDPDTVIAEGRGVYNIRRDQPRPSGG